MSKQVSRELESVRAGRKCRRSGDQLRITAQLIDATTGNHLWAERWDRELKDIFAIQDEITMKIAAALQVKADGRGWPSLLQRGQESLEAYLKILEGRELVHALNRDDNALARKNTKRLLYWILNPRWHILLGFTYVMDFAYGIDRADQ